MALHFGHRLDDVGRPGRIPYSPAGHGVRLGKTVHHYGHVLYLLVQRGDAHMLRSVVEQLFVYLVRYHMYPPPDGDLGYGLQGLPVVGEPRGIGWRV